MAVTLHLID